MLRIIGGEFRHRRLAIPDAEVSRPTMDKVREAVFSSIREKVPNAVFLDLFAGSGAVGLEALSRGASFVYFNEKDGRVLKVLLKNAETFDPERSKTVIMRKDYLDALRFLSGKGRTFDIVYLDPPYAIKTNAATIAFLNQANLLNAGALVIAEQTDMPVAIAGFALKTHKYGRKFIGVYEREAATDGAN